MSIQKKSLISSLNATKKANVAVSPAVGISAAGSIKPAVARPGVARPGVARPGVARPGVARPGMAKPATLRAGRK